jgi:hypothetical protein
MQDAPMVLATQLPLQEVLRTLGLGLEAARVRSAELVIDADGVGVFATGEYGQRRYDWEEIASQSRTQQGQRRPRTLPPSCMDPWAPSRWSVLLHVAGLLLDAQGVRACSIQAAIVDADVGGECQLTVIAGGREVFDAAALQKHVKWLRLRRGTSYVPPEPAPMRPWWARWRQL